MRLLDLYSLYLLYLSSTMSDCNITSTRLILPHRLADDIGRNSTVHTTALSVSMMISSALTWFDVDTWVAKDVSQSSVHAKCEAISLLEGLQLSHHAPTSHSKPVVLMRALSVPIGKMPHVGPCVSRSISRVCLPYSRLL